MDDPITDETMARASYYANLGTRRALRILRAHFWANRMMNRSPDMLERYAVCMLEVLLDAGALALGTLGLLEEHELAHHRARNERRIAAGLAPLPTPEEEEQERALERERQREYSAEQFAAALAAHRQREARERSERRQRQRARERINELAELRRRQRRKDLASGTKLPRP